MLRWHFRKASIVFDILVNFNVTKTFFFKSVRWLVFLTSYFLTYNSFHRLKIYELFIKNLLPNYQLNSKPGFMLFQQNSCENQKLLVAFEFIILRKTDTRKKLYVYTKREQLRRQINL